VSGLRHTGRPLRCSHRPQRHEPAAGRGDDPQQLAPFLAADRKLLLYHGYSDGFITPFRTFQFY
jgi:hypothetical protein